MWPRIIDTRNNQRSPERSHTTILGVTLLEVTELLDQRFDRNFLIVVKGVNLALDTRTVDQRSRVRHQSRGSAANVAVNLEHFLD